MARKADLEKEISEMNKKYKLKNDDLHLGLHQSYGGYQVVLKGGGSGMVDITNGYDTAANTINDLYKQDSKGRIKNQIDYKKKDGPKKKPTSKKKITATAKPKPAVKKMAAKKAPVKKK